LLCLIQ